MIVIVARFETDGDYCVSDEKTGLVSPPDDNYAHSGVFLCTDTDEAGDVLERVFKGIDADGYLWQQLVQMFAEASCALDDSDALRFGWSRRIGGNYEGTFLFVQKAERGEPQKPILRNSDKYCCELNKCPTCGHIVEGVESMENFKFCPGCGQRIDWEGALKDALGG